jgi:spore maturation protein CgeB
MKFALFYHSLRSDWNHGNAHFLRGIVSELLALGHRVDVYEPEDGWSLSNLIAWGGMEAAAKYRELYPGLESRLYRLDALDLERALADVDVVLVHEWNDPELVRRVGEIRRESARLRALFHDTHHRAVTRPQEMAAYDLAGYDGVLAFGSVLRDLYLERGWARAAWTWHEAADTRVFRPMPPVRREGDLVWVGNWGDEERTRELEEFVLRPCRDLGLAAVVYGVRYPEPARWALLAHGVEYRGWLPNHEVPRVYSRFGATVHVPRRPYTEALPGIPTIRVFEALACGIPLVTAPWEDREELFAPGRDYLLAKDGEAMRAHLERLRNEPDFARTIADNGLATVRARHTCAHRVRELFDVLTELGLRVPSTGAPLAEAGADA